MKTIHSIYAAVFFFIISAIGGGAMTARAAELNIVPKPVKVEISGGEFILNKDTRIIVEEGTAVTGEYLSDLLAAVNLDPKIENTAAAKMEKNAISIGTGGAAKDLGPEGYVLEVSADGILIQGGGAAGAFYGVQTLRQMIGSGAGGKSMVPCAKITDRPRFAWRGLMLDVSRHFFPKEFVLKYIDVMSMFKMNTFHFHLTEDQGWRIEIKRYPSLTKVGAWREKSGAKDQFYGPAGPAHGGFYTRDDIREILAFAEKRHVKVVPEIEMPGHSQAAIASVPGISCEGKRLKVSSHWGVHHEVYCPGREKTFEFLNNVLDEVIALFPSEYVHIGGDEVPKDRWRACAKCQERIKAEGLKDEVELQSWFTKKMEEYINGKGKKIIGWDEIIEGGLPPRAAVMSWRGTKGGIEAAKTGHDVVMSPTSHCYFDYKQADEGEPNAVGATISLEKVYGFEPVPDELTADEAKHILGAQGNLWTEHVAESSHAEYMAYPRACALAEVVWSDKGARDWNDFRERMKSVYPMLEGMGVNYRKPRDGE